jgi:hypothetical protein
VGTWGDGPFDNDEAADWCDYLHDVPPSERAEMIRTTLTTAARNTGYLVYVKACSAIAAAAIVASQLPGGTPITSPYAHDFLLASEALDLDDDLPQLAVEALDRILGDNSEWRELRADAGVTEFPQIAKLRRVLSGPSEVPGQIELF